MQSFSSSNKLLKEEKEKKEFPSVEIKEFQVSRPSYLRFANETRSICMTNIS